MKKIALIVAMAMLLNGATHAAEWRPVASMSNQIWFLDTSGLTSVSGSKLGWVKMESKVDAVKSDGVKYSIVKYAAHCKTAQLQVLKWSDYSSDGMVKNSGDSPLKSNDVYPESAGEALFEALCNSGSPLRKRTITKDTAKFTEDFFSWQAGETGSQ